MRDVVLAVLFGALCGIAIGRYSIQDVVHIAPPQDEFDHQITIIDTDDRTVEKFQGMWVVDEKSQYPWKNDVVQKLDNGLRKRRYMWGRHILSVTSDSNYQIKKVVITDKQTMVFCDIVGGPS